MTTAGAMDDNRRYVIYSRRYLENVLIALQNGEAGKAGELFWGSAGEGLRAFAACKGLNVQSHRALKNFVTHIDKDFNDSTILTDCAIIESLHHKFYDVQQEPVDIAILVPTVHAFSTKLLALIPPEAYREVSAYELRGRTAYSPFVNG